MFNVVNDDGPDYSVASFVAYLSLYKTSTTMYHYFGPCRSFLSPSQSAKSPPPPFANRIITLCKGEPTLQCIMSPNPIGLCSALIHLSSNKKFIQLSHANSIVVNYYCDRIAELATPTNVYSIFCAGRLVVWWLHSILSSWTSSNPREWIKPSPFSLRACVDFG